MKNNIKKTYLGLVFAICSSICNYLILFKVYDVVIVLILSLAMGIVFSYYYAKIDQRMFSKQLTKEFVISTVKKYNLTNDIERSLESSLDILSPIGFNYTYQDIYQNIELLNSLSLGVFLEPMKALVQKKSAKIYKKIIINTAEHNDELNDTRRFMKAVKDTLYFGLGFIFMFVIIRFVFGKELINYDDIVFRIATDAFCLGPMLISLVLVIIKEKKDEKSIFEKVD